MIQDQQAKSFKASRNEQCGDKSRWVSCFCAWRATSNIGYVIFMPKALTLNCIKMHLYSVWHDLSCNRIARSYYYRFL